MSEPSDSSPENAGSSSNKHLTNLQIRIVSAIVLAVVILGLVWLGGVVCRILAALVASIVYYEWATMRRLPTGSVHQWMSALCLAAVLALLILDVEAKTLFMVTAVATAIAAVHGWWSGDSFWNASGVAYAAVSGITLALIRNDDQAGLFALLFLFAVVWATDIFAYFAGRTIGGPKLAPAISPSKTWSGAVGGAVGGVAAGVLCAVLAGWGGVWIALVALVLAIVSQFGDLLESFLKRRQGVKDSSHLIPGHGGLMDRVDGLVAAGWALYVVGALLGSADNPASGLVGG